MSYRIRVAEGQDDHPPLLWDTIWNPEKGYADWKVADPSEKGNVGGLQSLDILHSAIILALFTDRRVPDDHALRFLAENDARGWWGDGVDVRDDLGETELGSLLWLLERAPMRIKGNPIERWAESLAIEALYPLIKQGAAEKVEATATADSAVGRLYLTISVYQRNNVKIYDRKFDVIWNQSVA